jgi:flotillin
LSSIDGRGGIPAARQVEAIRNLKIDKVTVWDSGNGTSGNSSTAGFLASLIRSLPPLHEIAEMAGVEVPEYLGRLADQKGHQTRGAPSANGSSSEASGMEAATDGTSRAEGTSPDRHS